MSLALSCYAPNPRARAFYDAGDYIQALKELQALAGDTCLTQARHLLAIAIAAARGQGADTAGSTCAHMPTSLVAFSEGVTPFGSPDQRALLLGDDPNEFEIVQFGLRLNDRQLAEAEKLATHLIGPHALSMTGAVGPTERCSGRHKGDSTASRQLLPTSRGKPAILQLPRSGSPLVAGMKKSGSNRILAQLVTELNAVGDPHELLFIESKMRELGDRARLQDLQRDIDLATAKGERFTWLEPGEEVHIVRYGMNSSFASQVELQSATSGVPHEVYWVDSCFIELRGPHGRALSCL